MLKLNENQGLLIFILLKTNRFKPKFRKVTYQNSEAATGGALQEKVPLEISQNSQESICASLFFNKVAG